MYAMCVLGLGSIGVFVFANYWFLTSWSLVVFSFSCMVWFVFFLVPGNGVGIHQWFVWTSLSLYTTQFHFYNSENTNIEFIHHLHYLFILYFFPLSSYHNDALCQLLFFILFSEILILLFDCSYIYGMNRNTCRYWSKTMLQRNCSGASKLKEFIYSIGITSVTKTLIQVVLEGGVILVQEPVILPKLLEQVMWMIAHQMHIRGEKVGKTNNVIRT